MFDYLFLWVKNKMAQCSYFMHCHHKAVKRTHHATHLCYFFAVTTHGPYHIVALGLLILGIVFLVFDID